MAKNEKPEFLWQDRLRHMGLPLSFTKYSIDSDRLYVQTGFFKTETNEILLYRILDVKSTRTLGQKIFGVGTVTLYSADQSNRTLDLKNVKDSNRVHKFISELVEKERRERGIAGREIVGTAGINMDHVDDCCQSEDIYFDDFDKNED